MTFVRGVTVSVVDVVDMVVVRNGHVPAFRTVLVVMALMRGVRLGLALVHVIVMDAVQATVVDIVDMIVVRDGHVPAAGSMLVSVVGVLAVFGSH
ncbi:hypothetical protein [Nonomuraea turkmeniaca]|uniref:hypothetical protein n=1 Tax=Nonomuraea turkmeniaca TaxID=103838 RepID=UPI001B86F1BF|nr:hypothetical protein [Nonomuraea turkmeniaca]